MAQYLELALNFSRKKDKRDVGSVHRWRCYGWHVGVCNSLYFCRGKETLLKLADQRPENGRRLTAGRAGQSKQERRPELLEN